MIGMPQHIDQVPTSPDGRHKLAGVLLRPVCIAMLLWAWAFTAQATDGGNFWHLQASVYTAHAHHDADHNNNNDLLGLERDWDSNWLAGAAVFRNSFRQHSSYFYGGKRFDSESYPVYAKLTGGLLHGYHGKHQDKVPLNHYGVAPVILPSLGFTVHGITAEVVLIGTNVALFTVGFRF